MGHEVGLCLPVDAQGTEAEHGDAHRGFLNERHELADVHSKRPVLCYQLPGEMTQIDVKVRTQSSITAQRISSIIRMSWTTK